MSMADYEEALALIQEHRDDADFAGPRDDQLIGAAEAALGLTFPPTYHRFVRELGAGGIGSEEVYGIIDNNFIQSSVPNGVWLTLRVRSRSKLPNAMIIVYHMGEGAYAVLDTAQVSSVGECPVVVWEPGVDTGDELEVIASDFGEFLLTIVKEGIASLDENE